MERIKPHAIQLCAAAFAVTLTLSACQKQDDPAAPQQQTPSLTEHASSLQKKAEEKLATAAEKAEATATKAAEKSREVAAETAQKVGTAVETAGQKTREAGEVITDKALSQPERLPAQQEGNSQEDSAQEGSTR
ncbi:MAG TPA: hypothetical protein VFV18_01315 [Porticoccaceae bacterium]|nr:hypothetical protein [Porticoccaceae bacterium]